MRPFTLFKLSLLLCASVTLFFGCFAVVDLGLFLREAVSAEGKVVRLDSHVDTRRVRSSSGYQAVVRFRKADGIPEEFVDENGYDPPVYSIGENVQVLYDPADAANARIDNFRSLWLAPLVLLFAGGLMLGIFATIHARRAAAADFRACAARLRARLLPARIALAPRFKSRIAYYAPAWCWPFLLLFIAQGHRPAGGGTGLDSKVSLAVFFLCNIPVVIGWLKGRLPWMEAVILWWMAPFLIWAALVLQM